MVASDTASANLIVNVTNDAWFGDTPGPYQHFRQAQIRTVETGRPLVRAANTGISGLSIRAGELLMHWQSMRAGVLDVTVKFSGRVRPNLGLQRLAGPFILLALVAFACGMRIKRYQRPN